MFQGEKLVENRTCLHCNSNFDITDKDLEFYEKISPIFQRPHPNPLLIGEGNEKSFAWKEKDLGWGKIKYLIPSPTLCPDCRQQRRLSFLNQFKLYKNVCLRCNKNIVSRISPKSWLKNYCNECWSKEDWNQLEYWIDVDFNKSMFSQVEYLIKNTPFQNLIWSSSNIKNNSIYTNHTSEIHNSYFVFEANRINESLYSFWIKNTNFAVDCSFVWNSEYLYECIDSYNMYNCFYCRKSFWCKFSYLLDNCTNCSYCIWCSNINNKSYYLFNKPIKKEEYEELIKDLSNYSFLKDFKEKVNLFFKHAIVKANNLVWSEKCTWDNIINSKNCINSFDVLECSDTKYSTNVNYSADLYDVSSYWEESNRMFESVSVWRFSNNILFSSIVWKWEKLIYCIDVKKSKNCFLCVNLEGKEYCILNKQYSKEEYEELVPRIIEYMEKSWEWWEFFPSLISPFWYNETLANEYFPLKKEEAIKNLFNWSDYESPFPKVDKIIPASKLPDKISDIPDDILNRAVECEITKKPFRIIKQELEFYRKHNLPIPRKHPDQRHLDRMTLRNPRKLYDRKCDKCGKDIKTTYAPDRSEIIYCEVCYNKEIY